MYVPSTRAASVYQGLRSVDCQQTNWSAAPGFVADRMLANAATGSSKNITPKRDTTRSKCLAGSAAISASSSRQITFVTPAGHGAVAGAAEQRRGDVDAHHTPLRSDRPGEGHGGRAEPAADVEHVVAERRRGPPQQLVAERGEGGLEVGLALDPLPTTRSRSSNGACPRWPLVLPQRGYGEAPGLA